MIEDEDTPDTYPLPPEALERIARRSAGQVRPAVPHRWVAVGDYVGDCRAGQQLRYTVRWAAPIGESVRSGVAAAFVERADALAWMREQAADGGRFFVLVDETIGEVIERIDPGERRDAASKDGR